MNINPGSDITNPIGVTELNRTINTLFQNEPLLSNIWVTGEISNWAVNSSSGHAYFSIKDEKSTISCAMWRGNLARTKNIGLQTGTQIKCHGSISIYEPQGKLQMIVDTILPAGEGAYFAEFMRVKALLEAEGLFDQERKKAIPPIPKNIGVVTSASGAALQDIINTLSRRMPLTQLWISPTLVQGTEAPQGIVHALERLILSGKPEVIIIARGGGSLEDLWAFNHEMVARAVAISPIPIISGVGHETDTTIVDFVADLRAPTPTAAAEMASLLTLDDLKSKLAYLNDVSKNLIQVRLNELNRTNQSLEQRLRLLSPSRKLMTEIQRLDLISIAFEKSIKTNFGQRQKNLESLSRQLSALNPNAVLARGYAIVQRESNEGVIVDATQVKTGERLSVHLKKGKLKVSVESQEQ
ncbi:MAG TPA: exodeoxyribonuclease VII large subunit [Anaerolineales bacterium]|nr:exodeoxyribonuclease VII large subunit [Anaerolineales bacterium]